MFLSHLVVSQEPWNPFFDTLQASCSCIVGTYLKDEECLIVLRLKILLITSLVQDLGMQQTCLWRRSGLQMGVSVPLTKEQRLLCFFVVLVLILRLLQGLAWSDVGGRTCPDAYFSIFTHLWSGIPKDSFVFSSGGWAGIQAPLLDPCSNLHPLLCVAQVAAFILMQVRYQAYLRNGHAR